MILDLPLNTVKMCLELHYDTHFNIIIIGHGLTMLQCVYEVRNEIFIGIPVD